MTAGTTSTCPRCGAGFHCGANDAQPCECSALTLAPAALQALRDRYSGCVCSSCLQQVQRERERERRLRLQADEVRVGD